MEDISRMVSDSLARNGVEPGLDHLRLEWERLATGRCFARYTVIEEADQRMATYKVFQRWMEQSAEAASGISPCGAGALAREAVNTENVVSDVVPSMSFTLGAEVQDRESLDRVRRPASLPLGF